MINFIIGFILGGICGVLLMGIIAGGNNDN